VNVKTRHWNRQASVAVFEWTASHNYNYNSNTELQNLVVPQNFLEFREIPRKHENSAATAQFRGSARNSAARGKLCSLLMMMMMLFMLPWLWELTPFIWWIYDRAKWLPTLRASQLPWAASPPVGFCHLHTPSLLLPVLLGPKADAHFTIPHYVEGWVDRDTAVRVLCIAVIFVITTWTAWYLMQQSQASYHYNMYRAGLTSMPIIPWHGPPPVQGGPLGGTNFFNI